MSDTDSPSTEQTSIRASDEERDHVRTVLDNAVATGRLTEEEAEERRQGVTGTRYRHELTPFTTDLPDETTPVSDKRPSTVRAATGSAFAAFVAVVVAIAALANRHRIVAGLIVLVVIAACASLIVFAGLDSGGHHGGAGQRPGRNR